MTLTHVDSVGIYDAKTHFASLVERVLAGETITITKHGRPVAKLGPAEEPRLTVEEMIAECDAIAQQWGRPNLDMRKLIGRDDH